MDNSRGPGTVITQYFPDAYKPKVLNGNFSIVHGVQNNFCAIKKRKENTENLPQLEEFHQVMKGSIRKKEDVGEPWLLNRNGKDITEAAVYTAEIVSFGTDKFTVKAYNGRKAKKAWRQDFLRCSNDWRREIPLFGYNKSSIPLLIFHGELIPIAHIEARTGWIELFYFNLLNIFLGCARNELWMDPTKGIFCRGPAGPKCRGWFDCVPDIVPIPSDIGFLKDDVLVRYFSSTKHDWGFLSALTYSSCYEPIRGNVTVAYPQVVSSLTNSAIAVIQNIRWGCARDRLAEEKVAPNGVTRFLLRHDRRSVGIFSRIVSFQWLLQSLNVFHAHNIQLDEDLSAYKLVGPYFKLTGTLSKSKCKQRCRRRSSPIFLFFLPSPSLIVQFYYWSHDPAGGIPLSQAQCRYLGLPFKLSVKVLEETCYWPTKVYKTLHDYQISRGFDPKTTDFARSLGENSLFEIVPPENRFEEVDEVHDVRSVPVPESLLALDDAIGRQEEGPIVFDLPDDSYLAKPDDDYSLNMLFNEVENGGPTRQLPSWVNWPFPRRGEKRRQFTIAINNRVQKRDDLDPWSDVD